ncbi:MAG: hypothetical protein FWC36_11065 [Spirochaetes bacterium]|nr:hypothetical protein [Spirochaetota bacterium]
MQKRIFAPFFLFFISRRSENRGQAELAHDRVRRLTKSIIPQGLLCGIILFICCSSALFAGSAPGFDNYVNFGISMRELTAHVQSGDLGPVRNRYLILNGSFVSFTVIDNTPATYTVEIELIDGEWVGVSDVLIFRAIIVFSGREFQAMFPERRRGAPGPMEIALNSGLIVVARLKETREHRGEVIPVLYGYHLRVFKSA